jgi:Haloacid dehalogenase-like hydrolase
VFGEPLCTRPLVPNRGVARLLALLMPARLTPAERVGTPPGRRHSSNGYAGLVPACCRALPMPLHTIIFDVEGTLVDCVPHVLRSWQSILATAGRPVGLADLQRYSGMDGGDMLERLLPDLGRAEKKKLLEAHGKLYCRDYLPLTRPFAGVRPLFVALKQQKYTLAIATSCTGDELRSYD